jgi:hypothetical protein
VCVKVCIACKKCPNPTNKCQDLFVVVVGMASDA